MSGTKRLLFRSVLGGLFLTCWAISPGRAVEGEAKTAPWNIVWIIGEDMGPDLACYGAGEVRTPNLDRLAGEGARYTRAFSTAPVCSASRSALITGMYQTSIGAHHHRSHRKDGYRLPDPVEPITEYLRRAGYYTVNATNPAPGVKLPAKTDFNFNTEAPVFEGDDWSKRKAGQPFFAQVSFNEPHRGASWPEARKSVKPLADPAKVALPPCYPDDPIARDDWANYLDAISLLDVKVGKVLKRLEEEKLLDHTVVFFFGDNGQCHVRGKHFLYDAGIHVPLIVRWPGTVAPGTVADGLVSLIDVAATTLEIAGVDIPGHLQGRVFVGLDAAEPRSLVHAARDRCDETQDRIRCVRTDRYKYIRNFYPEKPYTAPNAYKERQYPVLALMRRLYGEGRLAPEQLPFMMPTRPAEELYDLAADPFELRNLADEPAHAETLEKLRAELDRWIEETGDQGREPEEARSSR
jgi:arylsulfatase A-like enzyme